MNEQKRGRSQKYYHPPKDELEYLYIKKDHTIKELAELYGIPQYTIAYLITTKYNIEKKGYRSKRKKSKMEDVIDKGLTKERLKELYIEKLWPPSRIGKEYDEHHQYIESLLGYWDIPKRSKSENVKIAWEKNKREKEAKKREERSFIHRKAESIKKDIKTGKIDPSEIDHKQACILLSCNPGIEKLKKLCDLYGFDFQILANTYKKLEPIWFKLNLYPLINTKIALTLYLRYKISQTVCCGICHVTGVSFRTFYKILGNKIQLTKEKREDPLFVINIRWLFDNPNLPEIYEGLFEFSENYAGYYCNIANKDCEFYDEFWDIYRCNKTRYLSCFYAFTKHKKRR